MNLIDLLRGGGMGLTTGVLGAPVDIATLLMRPFGYKTEKPVGGSDWIADKLGVGTADSGEETVGRLATGLLGPAGAAKAAVMVPMLLKTGGRAKDALEAEAKLRAMPELAKRYQQTYHPVEAFGPKKKPGQQYYAAKAHSPEAEQVKVLRDAARKEYETGADTYQPFFDVSKRFDVDEANYPRDAGNTLTDALPKTAKTIQQWKDRYDTPSVRRRLIEAYIRGSGDEGAKNWYAMGQLEKEFVKELGPEAGRKAFRERFADSMAATTGGASPDDNLLMAAYSNYVKGDFPKNRDGSIQSFDVPFPVGGRYAAGNLKMADKVMSGGLLTADNQPKRYNFSGNFMGRKGNQTLDEQMMTIFEDPAEQRFKDAYAAYAKDKKKPLSFDDWFVSNEKGAREKAPPGDSYGVLEAIANDVAREMGVNPMNFQDVAWRGAKGGKGHPMIEEVNRMLHRTSRVTGLPQDKVLKGFIRGNMPMYGMGAGAVGLPFLLGGQEEEF